MRRVWRQPALYLLAFGVLVAGFDVLSRPYTARNAFNEATYAIARMTAVASAEGEIWAHAHGTQATTLAYVARLQLERPNGPAAAARFGATMDSLARTGDFIHGWLVGPGDAILASTHAAPTPGVTRPGSHLFRAPDGSAYVDFVSGSPDTLRPRVILRSRLTAEAFTRYDPTASRAARTMRTLVLQRTGDSIHAVVAWAKGTAPPPRSWLASSAPRSIRAAVRATSPVRGEGIGSAGRPAYFVAQPIPGLGMQMVREMDQTEALAGQPPVLVPSVMIAISLLALAYLVQSIWQSAQLRRERALMRLQGDFVSSVSHELRTPLTQIRMYAELMRTGALRGEAETARAVNVIEKEARRLAILVDNVLTYSRPRPGAPASSDMVTDIAGEVRHVEDAFGPLAAERGMHVRSVVPERLYARIDAMALRQILLNLLENAAKYGPRGQEVTIGASEDGGMVRVWVADQGPGVPAEERASIWEPFRRGQDPRVVEVPGSGIGLAVVRDVVVSHGGQVAVTDAPGGGARFEVRLPVAR